MPRKCAASSSGRGHRRRRRRTEEDDGGAPGNLAGRLEGGVSRKVHQGLSGQGWARPRGERCPASRRQAASGSKQTSKALTGLGTSCPVVSVMVKLPRTLAGPLAV